MVFTPVQTLEKHSKNLDLRQQMKQVFLRDFSSALAKPMK